MATFGIEAIRYFNHARDANAGNVPDLTYTFNRANGFYGKLIDGGLQCSFYFANDDCWETDIRDVKAGGDDSNWVDSVDIFWMETHGGNDFLGIMWQYDTGHDRWKADSFNWKLGDDWNAEWIMAFSCENINMKDVSRVKNIFARLHIYCGAYDLMWDGSSTDECGEDVGDNLINGDTISSSWIDGVSDWYFDNHPITVCVGDAATWNGGDIRWDLSYLNRDHLHGHGNVDPDLSVAEQACMLWTWSEG